MYAIILPNSVFTNYNYMELASSYHITFIGFVIFIAVWHVTLDLGLSDKFRALNLGCGDSDKIFARGVFWDIGVYFKGAKYHAPKFYPIFSQLGYARLVEG